MTVGVTGLTHFIVWRFIFQQPRRVSEMTDHFDITIDRMNALLRKLERMGFIRRVRDGSRKNGIVWEANPVTPGDPIRHSAV